MTRQRARELLENIKNLKSGKQLNYPEATLLEHEEVRLKFHAMKPGPDNWYDVLLEIAFHGF